MKIKSTKPVLILGSAPNATLCRNWPKSDFSAVVVINNAWLVREDWDYLVCPDDFPKDRHPQSFRSGQKLVGSAEFVPANNEFGGIVFAGATMAFTAAYWALAALRPSMMVFVGCDMIYPDRGKTHFYGTGAPDPLRDDLTLRNLEAKSARLMLIASQQGCACARLPEGESRLLFPATTLEALKHQKSDDLVTASDDIALAKDLERTLGYHVPSGRYWEQEQSFAPAQLDKVDQLWLEAFRSSRKPDQLATA